MYASGKLVVRPILSLLDMVTPAGYSEDIVVTADRPARVWVTDVELH